MPGKSKADDIVADNAVLALTARVAEIKATLAHCETQLASLQADVGRFSADTDLLNWLQQHCADRFWVWTGCDLLSYPRHARPNKGVVSYDIRTTIAQAQELR